MDAEPLSPLDEHALQTKLRLVCGERHVITDPAHLQVYLTAGSREAGEEPLVVVLPGRTAEVQGVLRAAHELGRPVIPRGAGTDPAGSARPASGAVLLVLSRMRVLTVVDRSRGEVRAQAGVPLGAIVAALGEPEPASLLGPGAEVPTVGGALAAGALGGEHVRGIELVLADGTHLRLDREQPGYDLAGSVIGAAGTTGVIVAAHLRLRGVSAPHPAAHTATWIADGSGVRRLREALDPLGTLARVRRPSIPV